MIMKSHEPFFIYLEVRFSKSHEVLLSTTGTGPYGSAYPSTMSQTYQAIFKSEIRVLTVWQPQPFSPAGGSVIPAALVEP